VYGHISAFGTDGYTLSEGADSGNPFANENESGTTYVSWNWKAGTSVSGNSTGAGDDIAYTGSVNTDAGFSIIRYGGNGNTGHQIPHRLGVVPDAIWIKNLTTQSWNCFFPNTSMGATKGLQLDNTGAQGTVSHLNNTMPSTSVVTLGSGAGSNTRDGDSNPQPYIMYSWKSIEGFSKIGEYKGNSNADGSYIHLGFRPAFVLIKRTDSSGQGAPIFDSARDEYNMTVKRLRSDSGASELNTDGQLDFLSDGFKLRNTDGSTNNSSGTYIYMAFAETPFKYSNAR